MKKILLICVVLLVSVVAAYGFFGNFGFAPTGGRSLVPISSHLVDEAANDILDEGGTVIEDERG